jgi:hypothetical protein
MTAWTELTFISFLAILTALYLMYLALANRDALNKRFALNFAALVAVAVIGVSPLAISLLGDTLRYGYYLTSGLEYAHFFAAEPISFLVPSTQHPLLGEWATRITKANTSYAFFGWAGLILAVLGFCAQRASRQAYLWVALAIVFALVMLGPMLIVGQRAIDTSGLSVSLECPQAGFSRPSGNLALA